MTVAAAHATPYEGDTYRLLMEQIIAGNGLAAVARLLADLVGLPAVVADEDFHAIHGFAPGDRALSSQEAELDGDLRERISFDLSGVPQASTAPPTVRGRGADGRGYTVAPIVLPATIVGYVWAADESGTRAPRVDRAVSHAAAAAAVEMVRQRAIVEGESRVRNSFLEDLLQGTVTSATATRRRAKFLGYELRGEQLVFILDMDGFLSYISRHDLDEAGIQRIKDRFRRSVEASIPAIWSKTLLWEHSDSIVVLAPARGDRSVRSARARVDLLRAQVEARLGGPSISAGIGRHYADLTRLRQSYAEAEHALQVGAAVSGPGSTSAFDELGAYRLLYHVRDQPELASFCEETLGELIRYDDQHGGHLIETLSTFLDLQGNLSQTARALHLHRNGLLYRMGRIERIAGCDLGNPSQRLALQIALLAQPLLRRKGDRGGKTSPSRATT